MNKNPRVLDVFCELDGFLAFIHILSTLSASTSTGLSSSYHVQDILECMQWAFMVASKALDGHEDNLDFFEEFVGYDALSDACSVFLINPATSEKMLGCLLSLSLHNFGLVDVFGSLVVCQDLAELDVRFLECTPSFGTIHLPHVFKIAWDFMARSLATSGSMRLLIYKILEHFTQSSHYNLTVLDEARVLPPVFSHFASSPTGISGSDSPSPERRLLSKILKRLFEIGASTQDVRQLLQYVVKENGALDGEMIEFLRTGMKCCWPPHISLQGPSVITKWMGDAKALPAAGFTFTMWVWFEGMPLETHSLFGISFWVDPIVQLSLTANGTLALRTKVRQDAVVLPKSKIPTARWTHIAIVHYPSRSSGPTIRIFVDGCLTDSLDWPYPPPDVIGRGQLILGDTTLGRPLSWCLASCYLLSIPLNDNLIKFMHGLGPQYHGNFQDCNLVRFFTYEVSTSLNMHLLGPASTRDASSLKRAIQEGALVSENFIMLKVVPEDIKPFPWLDPCSCSDLQSNSGVRYRGNVYVVLHQPFDVTLWEVGGVQLALRLVHQAQTQHELSRTISILCDSVRNSWQNSEEMEKIAGYDALANILRSKGHLINVTSFETLFEFLGLSFRSPDTSTVTNTIAYRAIALDFELWSSTNLTIQQAHLEHFVFLLRASRHRRFNAKVCLSKLGIIRKLVFALQSTWYPAETVPHLVNAIVVVMQGRFPPNDVIKPVISYISAHVATEPSDPPSPRSSSAFLSVNQHDRAKQLLEAVVSLLRIPSAYARVSESVPLARIVLLWVNEVPSPSVACQVLSVIGISLMFSSSFGKKLELLSGWNLLRKRLPPVWNEDLHRAAVDLLLRPAADAISSKGTPQGIRCPQILSVILVALRCSLLVCCDKLNQGPSRHVTELILDDLNDLHKTNPSFSQLFKSQSTTEVLIECLSILPAGCENVKISTQLTQFALLVAYGNRVSHHQKQQILDLVKPEVKALGPSPNSLSSMLAVVRGETLRKAINCLDQWRNVIIASEKERYQKMVVDLRERRRRLSSINTGILDVGSERDMWPHLVPERTWRLDETEGPYRMRIKLKPVVEAPLESRQRRSPSIAGEPEASSTAQLEQMADDAADDYGSSLFLGSQALAENIVEDKHRRVRHELEPGDAIEAVGTVARVSGVDSWPGLLIFGKSHLYMLEGLVEDESGEVINAADAPKDMFFVSGSTSQLRSGQPALRWKLGHIVGFSNRTFLFRDIALEVLFKDSRTLLVVFLSTSQRHDASQRLQTIIVHRTPQEHQSAFSLILRDMSIALPGGKASNVNTSHEKALATAQQQWQNRTISNYAYISVLNQLSGRTPNDATQYPIFPWVLQDYTSETLDLSLPNSFRDLTKPMGALTDARREIAESRYDNLESVGEKPFHYGTHFSSSMIVCHYLIRLAPFTNMFKTLQGGDWDLPDRLFSDIERSYRSASQDVRGDVRELIPEFFSCPEFLENLSHLDFGVSHSTGEKIDDVKLPPWAKDDPLFFVTLHRHALESRYVSENLPAWIDLIWGCKQRDVESLNVFHPLSYEGAIDLDSIIDPLEREATIGIIHNFGQTPRKLFDSPHPSRNLSGTLSLPVKVKRGICEDALALTRDARPLKLDFDGPVAHITIDSSGKVHPMSHGKLLHPSRNDDGVRWDHGRGSGILQAFSRGTVRAFSFPFANPLTFRLQIVQTIESIHPTCAAFTDPETLVTGSADSIVRIWYVSYGQSSGGSSFAGNVKHRKRREPVLSLAHLLRGHSGPVSCVQASRTWSVAVSGSSDGSAVLWDLNRGTYVRSIWHVEANIPSESASVDLVAINESTGCIATCSARYLWLHTIAARPIAKLDLSLTCDPTSQVSSIAFHEREYSSLGILAVGNRQGSVTLYTWNADGTPQGKKAQWEFVEVRRLSPDPGSSTAVSALKFSGETLWVGDASGSVFRWAIPD
ncbi:hypothetical protein BKA82DRAFT_965252 [Pisolithus tinctorius]|uniref:Beach-domain-containing protein n=1 Tax=Pisolithus tinctorius Marx 270 TaxID=870435 RepID=A0A0C3KQR6_PISTI|nr:hypothetical protein BKA82DRAFT_965252 [Pisolithus tinctorius]KIO11827.1 hypothetical protein M404DRAFT_965252 [Pisolithus tinctorius Marx 270]